MLRFNGMLLVLSACTTQPSKPSTAGYACLPSTQTKDQWLAIRANANSVGTWQNAFTSIAGMAKLHNTKSLLRALREASAQAGHSGFTIAIDAHRKRLP